jgi:hypothetical protein
MVRNTGGGGNAKKQGRKFQNNNRSDDLRKAEDKNELYAVVETIYGNGLNIYTHLGQTIWCRVPGKFKGRNKRNNFFEVGSWVLVGIYEWENEKQPKSCELMYIYDRNDVEQLQNTPGVNLRLLTAKLREKNHGGGNAEENEEEVDDAELEELGFVFSENNTNTTTMFADVAGNDSVVNFDDDAQINIDDI